MDNGKIAKSDCEFEDRESHRYNDGYSLSADVSESESSDSSDVTFSSNHRLISAGTASSPFDLASSSDSLPPPPITLPVVGNRHVLFRGGKQGRDKLEPAELIEAEMMKERFAKLLLGEDMSGGGKGVSTALAISNAITNLAATVFGDLWKLEPLSPPKKSKWQCEIEWLTCVSESIVELVPSVQHFPGGSAFEIMVTRQRSDLYTNLPALKKLDGILMSILDGFAATEFYYVDRGVVVGDRDPSRSPDSCERRPSVAVEERWWVPFPKVPARGLSEETRQRLRECRECAQQVFKATVAINSGVLLLMQVPPVYSCNLPKSEKDCLGETLHRYINADNFSPNTLLEYMDLSSEYSALNVANRLECALHILRSKHQRKKPSHARSISFWESTVKGFVCDSEKSKRFAHRVETVLKKLKLHFPGLPQTTLDKSKIQYNKDVGQSILEGYSRVLESLAYNLTARIDDLLYVDDATKQRAISESISSVLTNHNPARRSITGLRDPRDPYSPGSPFSQSSRSSTSAAGSPFRCLVPVSQRAKTRRVCHSVSQSTASLDRLNTKSSIEMILK